MKFEEIFGKAHFVTGDTRHPSLQLRGSFYAEADREKTEIVICGLGYFEMKINGRKVTDALFTPAYSHYHPYDRCQCYEKFGEQLGCRIYVMKYDITDYVAKGENVLAVELGRGWYSHPDFMHDIDYGESKLAWQITCGGKTFVSSEEMTWRDGCITEGNFYYGEVQDYTVHNYCDGWELPGYEDSTWEKARVTETPESEYLIQDFPDDRVIRSIYPRIISETEEHIVYDLGENITGWPIVRCDAAGEKVTLRFSEHANDGKPDERWNHGAGYSFVSDGADREYHPQFSYATFSCVEISKNARLVRCDVIHTDIEVTGEFRCDDDMINWFHEAFLRTQLDNIHNCIPSDCPQIEKRGYTGDGQLACETVMLMMDAKAMYRKWMGDISDCQDRISGHIQYTAPYVPSGGGPGGWGIAILEVPFQYYRIYGDKGPMEQYFDQMLHYFDYLEAHSEKDLVTSDQPGLWCLGEWCIPNFRHNYGGRPIVPAPFVNTYFYVKALKRMEEICRILGKKDRIAQLEETRKRKEDAIVRAYFDAATGDFAGNLNGANAFALDIGLGDGRTLNNLVAELAARGSFPTGIFGTDILMRVLFRRGYGDLAISVLTTHGHPSFRYMMDQGATTLWEEWFGPRSMCHPMFGALCRYFYYYLLGIRQKEHTAGFREIEIAPFYGERIRWVSGKIRTDFGDIRVEIDRRFKNTITIQIPQGVHAVYDGVELKPGTTSFALQAMPRLNGRADKVWDFEKYV